MADEAETSRTLAIEAAWSDLLSAASRLIELKPAATSFGRRNGLCTVAIWPDARHDLDHWPPPWVIRPDLVE